MLQLITIAAGILIIYHHLGYPLILEIRGKRATNSKQKINSLDDNIHSKCLPSIDIFVPAYNEAKYIAKKLRNLAGLKYPKTKFSITVACDGCTDNTAEIARQTSKDAECQALQIDIQEFKKNKGKVSLINNIIPTLSGDLVVLTDVTALVSANALLIAAQRFNDPQIGVVCGTYQLLNPGGSEELKYWNYQSSVKSKEETFGAIIGAHGAFYVIRKELFHPLEPDTINDDFILPMRIVSLGYRAIYEPRINSFELESASLELDFSRRRRIAAGNLQQLIRLRQMLHPSFKGVAFAFASGKGLRALMPFLLILFASGCAILAPGNIFFCLLLIIQVLVYSAAAIVQLSATHDFPNSLNTIHYIVLGYVAGLLGCFDYLHRKKPNKWRLRSDKNKHV
ncbi:MAG: glycosyl transferase [Cyanobium sp. ARS6]|nr:glycosyl transferase [Cyanobium sp. ARS6]